MRYHVISPAIQCTHEKMDGELCRECLSELMDRPSVVRLAHSLAESVGGSVVSIGNTFNGDGEDLAIIDCPDENASWLEDMLEASEYVARYS